MLAGPFDHVLTPSHLSGYMWLSSYLAGGDELQRPQSSAHVGDVGLELVQSGGNVGLDLIGLGPRWAVGRDLVECLLRHAGRLIQVVLRAGRVFAVCLKKKRS